MKQERRMDTNIIIYTKNGQDLTACFTYILNKTYRPTFDTKQVTGVMKLCNRFFCDSAIYLHNVKIKPVHY